MDIMEYQDTLLIKLIKENDVLLEGLSKLQDQLLTPGNVQKADLCKTIDNTLKELSQVTK